MRPSNDAELAGRPLALPGAPVQTVRSTLADSGADCDASEAAQLIAELVKDKTACPQEVAEQMRRLLAHDLAVTSTARLRFGHLRLLTHLIRTRVIPGPCIFISSYDYQREVDARREQLGEDWPDASALRRNYGHWLRAYLAAAWWWLDGGDARVPANYRHAHFRQSYNPEEVTKALIACRRALGRWPTEWEYERWSTVVRRTAATDQKLPIAKCVRNAFDGFELARVAAMDVWTEDEHKDLGAPRRL